MKKKILSYLLVLGVIVLTLCGCSKNSPQIDSTSKPDSNISNNTSSGKTPASITSEQESKKKIAENGAYSKAEEVAEYIHTYRKLPKNYLTKKEAAALGWESSKGNLWNVSDKMSIGGDIYGNREGRLPNANGRKWYECDVNYNGGFRGSERIVFSNDGLIYYTKDHYETFKKLY